MGKLQQELEGAMKKLEDLEQAIHDKDAALMQVSQLGVSHWKRSRVTSETPPVCRDPLC